MQSLRIVLVMIEPPLPFSHAVSRWYYVLLRGLVERGHRVTAFAVCSKPAEMDQARALFPSPKSDLRCYPLPKRSGLRAKWEIFHRPYSYMFGLDLRSSLKATLAEGFDILHLESIWSGWMGQGLDLARTVLNFHSLYDIDQANHPPLNWSDWIHRLLRRRAERRLLRNVGTLMTLSTRLQKSVNAIAPGVPVHIVPLAMDLSLYPFIPAQLRPKAKMISLIGSFDWLPTYSAAVRLLTRLWPEIRERSSDTRLQLVGWNAQQALRAYLPQAGVEVVENVPSTQSYFERASVLVYAPDGAASGMKVKVLEAFAYGVPVVTTHDGVEGLPVQDGVHADVCNDDAGLIAHTIDLLGDCARQERQRVAARQLLQACCSPQVALDRVERCYEEILVRQQGKTA
ncbi:MAG TPA: glycosyltransferase family 4 protein [Gemmataceae bacterium]